MSAASTTARATAAGYSGKPLARKLGLKPGMRASLRCVPPEYRDWCDLDEAGIEIVAATARELDFVHVFCRRARAARTRAETNRAEAGG